LTEVDQPTGNKVQFTYDADGNRISKTVTATSTTIKDVYALGHLSEQTDSAGNPLATFTYENSGRPASVVLGNPATGNRYYYVYNGHGDVVALTDSSGTPKASYTYDAFGILLSSSETLEGWSNPYRYDGADLVRYDSETGLYWMSVRAYDPTLGRFISHDPLGRLAAEGIDFAPYVYAGNNPLIRVDPSGQRFTCGVGDCGGVLTDCEADPTLSGCPLAGKQPVVKNPPSTCATHWRPPCVVPPSKKIPPPQSTSQPSCDSACGAFDKTLITRYIAQQNAATNIGIDIGALAGDGIGLWGAIAAGTWFAAISIITFQIVPDLANLGGHIADALGYTPNWLSGMAKMLHGVSAFLAMAQGFMGFMWVLSAMADPILGAVKDGFKFAIASAVLFFKGLGRYIQLLTPDQLAKMDPIRLHDQCLAYAIKGCK
ncbi:MAG: RHS repeat-associated core domain-containing protein, partial [Ktedonobacteraceae bacterium]